MTPVVLYSIAGVWLASLLVAVVTPARAKRGMRRPPVRLWLPILVVVTTLAFAVSWRAVLFDIGGNRAEASRQAARGVGSCASLEAGQTEQAVRVRLGPPGEVRSETELRGPGATVWIYRDSRCAVHLLDGTVESID